MLGIGSGCLAWQQQQRRRWHCVQHTCARLYRIYDQCTIRCTLAYSSLHVWKWSFLFGILQPANILYIAALSLNLICFHSTLVRVRHVCAKLSNSWLGWNSFRATEFQMQNHPAKSHTISSQNIFKTSTHLIFTLHFILFRSLLNGIHVCVCVDIFFFLFLIFLRHLFFSNFFFACQSEQQLQWKWITNLADPFDGEDIWWWDERCVRANCDPLKSKPKKSFLRATIPMH